MDDGYTDISSKVIGYYLNKDGLFQYHHRSIDRLKGVKAFRNYGFGWSEQVQDFFNNSFLDQ